MPTIFVPKISSSLTEEDVRKKFEEVNIGVIESVEMSEHTRGYLTYRNFKVQYSIKTVDEVDDANHQWGMLHFAGSLVM